MTIQEFYYTKVQTWKKQEQLKESQKKEASVSKTTQKQQIVKALGQQNVLEHSLPIEHVMAPINTLEISPHFQAYKQLMTQSFLLARKNQVNDAVQLIKLIILQRRPIAGSPFRGIGFPQNWNGHYSQDPMQWMQAHLQKTDSTPNLLDLLNFFFMVSLEQEAKTIQRVLEQYQKLLLTLKQYELQLTVGMAHAYFFDWQFLKAQKYYLKAEKINKRCQQIFESLCWVKGFCFKQRSQSLRYAEKCLSLNKDNIAALLMKAYFQDLGNRSLQIYRGLIAKNPACYKLYVWFGQKLSFKQAIKQYQKALQFDEKYINAYVRLSLTYFRKNSNFEQAIHHLRRALQIKPNSPYVLLALGEIYQKTNVQMAIKTYQKCISLQTHCFDAIKCLAKLYQTNSQISDLPKALILYKSYLDHNPYDYTVYLQIGQIYFQRRQFTQGLKYFTQSHKLSTGNMQIAGKTTFRLAQGHFITKNYNMALSFAFHGTGFVFKDIKMRMKMYEITIECSLMLKLYQQGERLLQIWLEFAKSGHQQYFKEIYRYYGLLFQEKGEFCRSLHWFLQMIQEKKVLFPFAFVSRLINRINYVDFVALLQSKYVETKYQTNKDYKLLQIGILFHYLGKYQRALPIFYEFKAALQSKRLKDSNFIETLQQVLTSQSKQQVSMVQYCMVKIESNNYWRKFRQIYREEGNN